MLQKMSEAKKIYAINSSFESFLDELEKTIEVSLSKTSIEQMKDKSKRVDSVYSRIGTGGNKCLD